MLRYSPSQAEHQLTTRECEELDDWSAAVGWQTCYQQLGRGKFEAWFDMYLGDELCVVDQYCSREVFGTGIPPANLLPLLIPLNRGPRGVVQGRDLGEYDAFIVPPGCEGTFRAPADLRMTSLYLSVSRVRQAFQLVDEELDLFLGHVRSLSLSKKAYRHLAQIGRKAITTPPTLGCDGRSHVWHKELEEEFVTAVISSITEKGKAEPGRLARQNHVRVFKAARDYIEANLDAALGLETLARVTDASPRALEYAFATVLDTSPTRYVKNRRLHAVRRRLLQPGDPNQTVTRVAVAHGFNHLGHFARDYRTLFGETPSETRLESRL